MSGKTKQPKHKMSAMAKKEERTAWLFIALPFLGFLLFMAYPICFAVFASMSKWTGMNSLVDNFCGLQNYINIFHDEKFWKSLLTTIIYLIGIPIGMILGLLLAMGMNRKIPGIRLLRTMYYVPVVSSLVAVSILWAWVYNYDYGLFNSIIKLFLLFFILPDCKTFRVTTMKLLPLMEQMDGRNFVILPFHWSRRLRSIF